jgi:hypothetical protein
MAFVLKTLTGWMADQSERHNDARMKVLEMFHSDLCASKSSLAMCIAVAKIS